MQHPHVFIALLRHWPIPVASLHLLSFQPLQVVGVGQPYVFSVSFCLVRHTSQCLHTVFSAFSMPVLISYKRFCTFFYCSVAQLRDGVPVPVASY